MVKLVYILFFLGETSAIGAVLGLAYLHKQHTPPLRVLLVYFVACVVAGVWKLVIVFDHQPTLWILNLFLVAEIVLVMLYCYYTAHQERAKQVFLGLAFLLGLLSVVMYQSDKVSDASWINAVAIIAGTFYLFYETLEYSEQQYLTRTPHYWFLTAFLLYFTGSFFIFLHNRYVFVNGNSPSFYLEGFRYFLLVGRNALFCVGIWHVQPSLPLRYYLLGGWVLAALYAVFQYVVMFG